MEHGDAIDMLKPIALGFDRHDLEGIMAHFADDAVFEAPRGPDRWGRRVVGKEAVRDAFAGRFTGIPDVRYQDDEHSSMAIGERRNGRCPARRRPASESRSEAVTCGRFATARS